MLSSLNVYIAHETLALKKSINFPFKTIQGDLRPEKTFLLRFFFWGGGGGKGGGGFHLNCLTVGRLGFYLSQCNVTSHCLDYYQTFHDEDRY